MRENRLGDAHLLASQRSMRDRQSLARMLGQWAVAWLYSLIAAVEAQIVSSRDHEASRHPLVLIGLASSPLRILVTGFAGEKTQFGIRDFY